MKKLFERDIKLRQNITSAENAYFVLKSIIKNSNFFNLLRWNAIKKLDTISNKSARVSLGGRCLLSTNRKRFSKLTGFSRHIFLKIARSGDIPGLRKSNW